MSIRQLAANFGVICWIGLISVASAGEVCPDNVATTAFGSATLAAHASVEAARDAAVRQALLNAVSNVGGIEIGRTFSSVERSTLSEINHETLEKLRMRSSARVLTWHVEGEEQQSDGTLEVTIGAIICPDPERDIPLVVAFAFAPDLRIDTRGYRERLSGLFPGASGYELNLARPEATWYDLLVTGRIVTAESRVRDRTQAVQILQSYLGTEQTAHLPTEKQRVRVEVMVWAETFMGETSMVVVKEGLRDIAVGMDPSETMAALSEAAMIDAAKEFYGRTFQEQAGTR